MKAIITAALADIKALPYKTGKDFENACLNILVAHFKLTSCKPTDRTPFNVTKGAEFFCDEAAGPGVTVIFQPHGSQASPDLEVWVNYECVLAIECKANSNASQPNWNQHIPYQDVLYIWTSEKRGEVIFRVGDQLIGPAEAAAVRAFYQLMKDQAKAFVGPLNQSSLDVALRFNLSPERRRLVLSDDPILDAQALDWACRLF